MVLAVYLAIVLAVAIISFPMDPGSEAYYRLYQVSEPVIWLLQYLVVGDMIVKTFRPYPGIQKLAIASQILGLFVAVVSGIVVGSVASNRFWHPRFQAIHICVMLAGLIFVIILTAEMALLPVEVSRNTKRYIGGFMIVFLIDAAFLFVLQGSKNIHLIDQLSQVSMVINGITYFYWCFSMQASDEKTPIPVQSVIANPEFQRRLRSHLTAFDRSFAERRTR